MKSALVIGGGFSGCAMAHQLKLQGGWDITLVERAPFLGAGVKTRFHGGHPYTIGPRHFLTPWSHVFEYLNTYVPMRRCAEHEFVSYVENDQAFYSYPIHRDDIALMPEKDRIEEEVSDIISRAAAELSPDELKKLSRTEINNLNLASKATNFEEFWTYSIGRTLYEKFVDKYSRKMWMIDSNEQIDDFTWSPKGVTIKDGPRAAWDTAISAYPIAINGYDDFFKIAAEGINVMLSTTIENYDIPNRTVILNGEKRQYDIIVSTISPDVLFDMCHGELPYVGREVEVIVLPVEYALPPNVFFAYYAGDEPYTRIVEYKKFTRHKSPHTLITVEKPSRKNRYYPLPFEKEKAKAHQYFDEMPDEVFSIGRAGSYLYNVDIDDTIEHAMRVAKDLKS